MLRSLLTISLICCTTATAIAQSPQGPLPPNPSTSPTSRSLSGWPDPQYGKTYSGHMDIVTIATPSARQPCNLRELTAETITCKSSHHRPDAIFQRNDVLALIAPPEHDNLIGFVLVGLFVAAVLTASFFVPFGWAIALRIVGGFFFFAGWAAGGEYSDQNLPDHSHDILLYQRPNTQLTVPLR